MHADFSPAKLNFIPHKYPLFLPIPPLFKMERQGEKKGEYQTVKMGRERQKEKAKWDRDMER